MSVCVVPFQVEIGRLFAYIGIGDGDGTATWGVINWGNMACSCLCSCCHRGQSCGCIVGLIFVGSVAWIGFGLYPRCADCLVPVLFGVGL